MKRYARELIILFFQFLLFYVYPYFAAPADPMVMVLIILIMTFLLAFLAGLICRSKVKYLYPAAAALLFIPSVFIHYNESALIHSLWYLILSSAGLLPGSLIRRLCRK